MTSQVKMQQNGITTKNKTSSKGRFAIRIGQTPSGLKYQWLRQVAKISQKPKIKRINPIL